MPFSDELAARIRSLLKKRRSIIEKRIFGCVAFLHRGNVVVGVWKDSLLVRVGPTAYDGVLDERHVREFDITGRPMRGWVLVEPEGVRTDALLEDWIDRAFEFVDTLPPK